MGVDKLAQLRNHLALYDHDLIIDRETLVAYCCLCWQSVLYRRADVELSGILGEACRHQLDNHHPVTHA